MRENRAVSSDPFEVAFNTASDDLGDYLSRVKALVRYADITRDGKNGLTIERFSKLRQLAIYDYFSGATNAEKAERLETSKWSLTDWRKTDNYARVLARLEEVVGEANKDRTMMEAAEAYEPVLVSEVLNTALHGSGRDKLKAIDEFTGRMSSKRGREGGEIRLRMPDGFLEQMREAQQIQEAAQPPNKLYQLEAAVIDVSATEVKVPEYKDE